MLCYTYKTSLTLLIVRKTPKLIEGGHRDLQDYRHICYYLYVFYVFFKIQSRDFLRFFAVSYVFSNYVHNIYPKQIISFLHTTGLTNELYFRHDIAAICMLKMLQKP